MLATTGIQSASLNASTLDYWIMMNAEFDDLEIRDYSSVSSKIASIRSIQSIKSLFGSKQGPKEPVFSSRNSIRGLPQAQSIHQPQSVKKFMGFSLGKDKKKQEGYNELLIADLIQSIEDRIGRGGKGVVEYMPFNSLLDINIFANVLKSDAVKSDRQSYLQSQNISVLGKMLFVQIVESMKQAVDLFSASMHGINGNTFNQSNIHSSFQIRNSKARHVWYNC